MQTTLDGWHRKTTEFGARRPKATEISKSNRNATTKTPGRREPEPTSFESDEEDQLLQLALEQSLAEIGRLSTPGEKKPRTEHYSADEAATSSSELDGFDFEAGKIWIYPTNRTFRQYQFDISASCLFRNTLVTLPTGLGKTFIAAVVMYNFYRWYPNGKVIFMAPTRPLVAQQIAACYEVMGIDQEHMVEMTGSMQPAERAKKWSAKRIFFATPQIMSNDLATGAAPARLVKCVVFDEAHRATGNYAFCQVIRELLKLTDQFRVLALSATPGKDVKVVQQVISNLLISKMELRCENSPELAPFSHARNIEKMVVALDDEMKRLERLYLEVLENYIYPLNRASVLPTRDLRNYDKFTLLQARDRMRAAKTNGNSKLTGQLEYLFAASMSLCHGLELLLLHGQRTCYNYLTGLREGDKTTNNRLRDELGRNRTFCELMALLADKYGAIADWCTQAARVDDMLVSHPKLKKLIDLLLDHFNKASEKETGETTRVIVFSQYRDSVEEICSVLRKYSPLIKPTKFVGQAGVNGKNGRGFSQKEQLRVVKEFKTGGYNALIATCVGEEGLDIAEVDLIVCYDSPKSPVRLVQRMGRTGRKRLGRIVVLLTEGREEQIYKRSESQKAYIFKAIQTTAKFDLYDKNPRMVPAGREPQCVRRLMQQTAPFDCLKARATGKKAASCLDKNSKFLTDEELNEWKSRYKVSAGDFRAKPLNLKGRLLVAKSESNSETLDLSRFYLWQNEVQPSSVVGHSSTSRTFVDLMRKCDYFHRLGEENPQFVEFFCAENERDLSDAKNFSAPLRNHFVENGARMESDRLRPNPDRLFPDVESERVSRFPKFLKMDADLGFKIDSFFRDLEKSVVRAESRLSGESASESKAEIAFDFELCANFDELFGADSTSRPDFCIPEQNFDADFSFDFDLETVPAAAPSASPRKNAESRELERPKGESRSDSEPSPLFRTVRPLAMVKPFRINDSVVEEDAAHEIAINVASRRMNKRKATASRYGNEFINAEADVSFFDCSHLSADEVDADSDLDTQRNPNGLDSFVDMNSQPEFLNTQRRIDSPTEMRAVYLKSLDNSFAVGRRNKFKLAYEKLERKRRRSSSEPDEGEPADGTRSRADSEGSHLDENDTYDLEDGFVVPNDFVEFASQTQNHSFVSDESAPRSRVGRPRRKTSRLILPDSDEDGG